MCCFRWLALFSLLLWGAESAKILAVFPMPSYSHFSIGFRIAKELADRGHQVTAINPYPQKTPIKNYRDVSVEENVAYADEVRKTLFNTTTRSPVDGFKFLSTMGYELCSRTLSNKNVQDLLNSDESFDLVIIEHFLNDALSGFAEHYKAPLILISGVGSSSMNNYIFANPAPSSYVPNIMTNFPKTMSFWQRVANFLFNTVSDIAWELMYRSGQREIFKKYFKSDLVLDDVIHNTSLLFVNSHVSFADAVPHVPSIIEIGGYHVSPPKDLPEDLKKFLDDSKEGVVLFSMGSNLKSKDLKPEVKDSVLKSFAKIKQKVLWKFEADLDNLPKNVKIMKWVPQRDVLAHPNVKAFISHGGLLSTIETITFGVPIIGIPVFGDQEANVASAVRNGYAVTVPLGEISEEKFTWALNEILNNPKYGENAKQRSRLMNDQPLKPIDTAMYWVEHVLRHKGAPHLRTAGVELKWYQRNMIDIYIFLASITIITISIFYIITKKVLRLCIGKKSNVKVSNSKKNK